MNAIYVRTSTDDNDGEAQLYELRQWCVKEGWKNPREYVDRGESGAKASRPAWDALHKDVRAGKVQAIAATQLSRFGRSVVNVILALDDLHRLGVRVVLLREQLDYSTAVGRAIAAILAAVAALEREQITERIRAGVRRAKEKGSRSGRAIGRPRRKISAELLEVAVQRRLYGVTWECVAELAGVAETTIRREINKYWAAKNPPQTAAQNPNKNPQITPGVELRQNLQV